MGYFYKLFFILVLFAIENVSSETTKPPDKNDISLQNITSTVAVTTTSSTPNTSTTTTSPPKKHEYFSEFQLQQLQELQEHASQGGLPQEDVDSILQYDKNLCYTDACLESALEIMEAVNFTANPCNPEEWKEFACQRRLDNDIVDSQMDQLDSEAEVHMKELLADKTGKYDKYFLLKEAQTYYQQCLNKGENNEKDVKEILKYMSEKYGNWPLMSNLEPGEKFNWFGMLADMNSFDREGFIPLLLSIDMVHSTDKIIFKVKPGATKYTEKRQENYIHLLVFIYKLSGVDKPWKGTQLRSEKRFLESVAENVEGVTFYEHSNVMTILELQNATNDYFLENNITLKNINWMDFFQRVSPYLNVTEEMEVNLQFEDVMALMETVNKTFEDEGMSPVANSLQSHWVTMFVQETTSLTDELASYQCTEKSEGYRESTCRERVKTIFGVALGKAYLSEFYSGPITTAGIDKMMQTIKGAYKAIIWDTDDWMSNGTKSFLDDKLEDMEVAYVQPEWIDKPEKLKELYKGLKASADVNSSYAENYLSVQQWYTGIMLKATIRATEVLTNTPVDKKAYFDYIVLTTYTGDVNAYYLYETNQIFVTGGMSRSPLFDINRPGFMNYGGLGSVLGHEIGHSFDTNGRKYDKNGNKGEHWDKNSADRYEKLWVKRIAADYNANLQYEGFTADQTIDEDIADIFGVYLSFESYVDYLTNLKKEGKSELVLPGLKSFTPEKLFYMKYANVWCNQQDPDHFETFITSEHSGTNVRATMPLRRSRQFAEVFGCPIPPNYD